MIFDRIEVLSSPKSQLAGGFSAARIGAPLVSSSLLEIIKQY